MEVINNGTDSGNKALAVTLVTVIVAPVAYLVVHRAQCNAGGREFETPTGPTLGDKKVLPFICKC